MCLMFAKPGAITSRPQKCCKPGRGYGALIEKLAYCDAYALVRLFCLDVFGAATVRQR
jgi:hypothetical protein